MQINKLHALHRNYKRTGAGKHNNFRRKSNCKKSHSTTDYEQELSYWVRLKLVLYSKNPHFVWDSPPIGHDVSQAYIPTR